MTTDSLDKSIEEYEDFPKKGILFRDIFPLLSNPNLFSKVIESMASSNIFRNADAILAIDARGFIFGTAIGLNLSKPILVARKPGKLPGELITKSYSLEYGTNSLSIQKNLLKKYKKFAIVDDLLATGGTVKCVSDILKESGKEISGLSVVIELKNLNGRSSFTFPVDSQLSY